ncbi:MAG TPA: efflux RND transporter periplasmic adaptor subunit [Thermohalobaculum sp.]|nr:efflux RND transporter periplasmic adaptor subunit [Thermohalobaculum sp.]
MSQLRPLERETEEMQPAPLWHRTVAFVLKSVIAIAIVAGAAYAAREIMLSAPVADRSPRERVARLVEVTAVEPATQGPVIEAWGEVVARRTLSLSPEVGGRVEWVNPALTPGGRVEAGEELLRIDERNLALEIARAEAAIAQIEARIRIEEGQQQRAERDLERGTPLELTEEQRALVMRAPQKAALEGELAAAEATRDEAELALSKAVVRAPFDALVQSDQVAEGTTLSANAEAASLVAADAFRVKLAVPVTALDWIDIDDGQTVRLTQPDSWAEGTFREGHVERLAPGLTDTGRMAELIVAVPDPLALSAEKAGKPPLLIGSFLRGEIEGRAVEDAVALPRAWLRDGAQVWVMNDEDRLEIRDVTIAWRGADTVLISDGLAPGERVVTTHLAVVADGMELRTGDQSDAGGGAMVEGGAEPAAGG